MSLINDKTYFITYIVIMFRVGEISSLEFLSQNAVQLLVKHNLDCIIEGSAYITLSALVMWEDAQVYQIIVLMSYFLPQGQTSHRVVLSVRMGGGSMGKEMVCSVGGRQQS